jgi:xanthine dehydrogenase molybdopterin-binding subunit B
MAVKNACDILRERLAPVAAKMLSAKIGRDIPGENICFANDFVFENGSLVAESILMSTQNPALIDEIARGETAIPFTKVVQAAYVQRIGLSSTGYYATPEIHYDRAAGRGKPFLYFAVGAAATEVEVDGFTGMTRMLRTDILQDVGDSINPGINLGQIEGGFVQGAGWLTCEELVWNDRGALLTHSPDTYKIPAVGDRPLKFNVRFLENATQRDTIHGSKASADAGHFRARSHPRRHCRLWIGPGRNRAAHAGDLRSSLVRNSKSQNAANHPHLT